MIHAKLLVSLVAVLALSFTLTSGASVDSSTSLLDCLESALETECSISVPAITYSLPRAILVGSKILTSSLEGGSTIELTNNVRALISAGAGTLLTVRNIRFTTSGSFNSGNMIASDGSTIEMFDVLFEDYLGFDQILMFYGSNITIDNVVFRRASTLVSVFVVEETNAWFNNVIFDDCSTAGRGLIGGIANHVSPTLHFTGNISILNYASSNPSAITFETSAGQAFDVTTDPENPSNFFMRSSPKNLFAPTFSGDTPSMSITIGSVDVDTADETIYYLLHYDVQVGDTTYNMTAHVLGNIKTNNYGIVSRGKCDPSRSIVNPSKFTVDGDIIATHSTNDVPFLLGWPVDISARSINYEFLPGANSQVLSSLISFGTGWHKSSFTVTNNFDISSSKAPLVTSFGSPSPPSAISIVNQDLVILAGTFSMSNFSMLPTPENYDLDLTGAAIRVADNCSLSIETTSGGISFSGNKNSLGNGGAIFASDDALEVRLLALQGDIVFENNIGYYGGAIYTSEASSVSMSLISGTTRFIGNAATCAGGAVYMPLSLVSGAVPSGSAYFDSNTALEFGCVFAFGPTASASNSAAGACPSNYESLTDSGNIRPGSGYTNATTCSVFERMCDPFTPSPPTTTPVVVPSATPTPTTTPTAVPTTTPTPQTSPVSGPLPPTAAPRTRPPTGSSSTLGLSLTVMMALLCLVATVSL